MKLRFTQSLLAPLVALALTMTGTVPASTDPAEVIVSGRVWLGDSSRLAGAGEAQVMLVSNTIVKVVTTDASGFYSVSLPPSRYRIEFSNLGADDFVTMLWPGVIGGTSQRLEVGPSGATVDMTLPIGTRVSGSVVKEDGSAAWGLISLEQVDPNGPSVTFGTGVSIGGVWEQRNIPAGEYSIAIQGGITGGWGPYKSTPWLPEGETVTVLLGAPTTGIDLIEPLPTFVTVVPRCAMCEVLYRSEFANLMKWTVDVEAYDAATSQWRPVTTYFDGMWTPRPSGELNHGGRYRLVVTAETWGGGLDTGPPVEFTASGGELRVDYQLNDPDVERISGSDRFEVAASISRSLSSHAPVAYIANGLGFADALSAGPVAAIEGGPLLLVTPGSIPSTTRTELARLNPQRIVVVGGPASVSDAVFAQLEEFAPVERVSGVDRYSVSRKLALRSFENSTTAILATGNTFPDALSAGATAAALGAPVITVNGLLPGLDAATEAVLEDLGVEKVYIAGGPASVSPGIEARLSQLGYIAERLDGEDRYSASRGIAAVLSEPPTLYLAVGTTFPDALAGAALAGRDGSALIVVPAECIPGRTLFLARGWGVERVVLLGGPASLSSAVEDLTVCTG